MRAQSFSASVALSFCVSRSPSVSGGRADCFLRLSDASSTPSNRSTLPLNSRFTPSDVGPPDCFIASTPIGELSPTHHQSRLPPMYPRQGRVSRQGVGCAPPRCPSDVSQTGSRDPLASGRRTCSDMSAEQPGRVAYQ